MNGHNSIATITPMSIGSTCIVDSGEITSVMTSWRHNILMLNISKRSLGKIWVWVSLKMHGKSSVLMVTWLMTLNEAELVKLLVIRANMASGVRIVGILLLTR